MACLLYCVTLTGEDPIPNLVGAASQPVVAHDSGELRFYWSEIANAEELIEGTPRKTSEQKYQQVLRQIVTRTTAIAFPFPALLPDLESLDAAVTEQREYYREALRRLEGTVQYELAATWAQDDGANLATPVKGREYLKRRQETEARTGSIDAKLRMVTVGIVREWRSRQERKRHLWFALLARDDRERFITALRSASPSEGVRLRMSGPWPPNEFVRTQP